MYFGGVFLMVIFCVFKWERLVLNIFNIFLVVGRFFYFLVVLSIIIIFWIGGGVGRLKCRIREGIISWCLYIIFVS